MRTNEERSRLIHKRTAEIKREKHVLLYAHQSKTEYREGLMRSA